MWDFAPVRFRTARSVRFYGPSLRGDPCPPLAVRRRRCGAASGRARLNGRCRPCFPEPDPALCGALAADLRDAGFHADALRAAWGDVADDAIARGLRRPADRALGDRARPARRARPAPRARDAAARRSRRVGAAAHRRRRAGRARARASRGWRRHPSARDRPPAVVRRRPRRRASGGSRATSTRPPWAGRCPRTTCSASAAPRSPSPGCSCPRRRRAGSTSARDAASRPCARGATSTDVVATDVSERALRFTRLNALLNGVDGIETRPGALFEPVAGEQFDRIVSNPPFVITPRAAGVPAYEYRDGGMVGRRPRRGLRDAASVRISRRAASHSCSATGRAATAIDGLDRVRGVGRGIAGPAGRLGRRARVARSAVVRRAVDPRRRHAAGHSRVRARWSTRGSTTSPRAASPTIGFGYVLLRRPVGGAPTLARYERVPQALDPRTALGAHYADALAAHDRLAALDDDGLAASVLVVAPDVTEARHHLPGVEAPSVIELRQGGGFARTIAGRPRARPRSSARATATCRSGVLIDAIAELLEVDAGALRADLLPRGAGAGVHGLPALRPEPEPPRPYGGARRAR